MGGHIGITARAGLAQTSIQGQKEQSIVGLFKEEHAGLFVGFAFRKRHETAGHLPGGASRAFPKVDTSKTSCSLADIRHAVEDSSGRRAGDLLTICGEKPVETDCEQRGIRPLSLLHKKEAADSPHRPGVTTITGNPPDWGYPFMHDADGMTGHAAFT
jgi:hypothetical protein